MSRDNAYAMRLMIAVGRGHKKACEAAAAGLGIHHSQHVMLMKISKAKQGISQTELSHELEISAAAVAVTAKKLEAGGYIKRNAHASDSRYNNLKITDKGRDIVAKTHELFGKIDEKTFSCLSDDEFKSFVSCLEKISEGNGHK